MATKTSATKASKTSKTSSASKTSTPSKTQSVKTTTSKSSSTPAKSSSHKPANQKHTGRIVATIIGIIAVVALVIITVVCLANNINKNGKNNLTVVDGDGQKVTTQYLGFDDYSFQLKIPTSFKAMTDEEIADKYGKDNAPKVVYTNDANDVNIAISPTESTITNDQIETYLNTMKSVLSVGGDILGTNYFTQGDHNIGTMQLTTDGGNNDRYYNEMMFFSQDDKLTMVNFNCKDALRTKWQPVGEFIMKSIDFTK